MREFATREFLLGAAFTMSVVVALIGGYLIGGGGLGSGNDSGSAVSGTPVMFADVGPTNTAEAARPAFETPTPLPNRTTCSEIAGTAFRSESERDFFYKSCVATAPAPTSTTEPSANAQSVSNPPAPPTEPPPPPSNRFTWQAGEGEYLAFSTTLCQSGSAGYTVSGEYAGRSFCTQQAHPGVPPFTCPEGAHADIKEATAGGQVIGEVFCITPYTPTPPPQPTAG